MTQVAQATFNYQERLKYTTFELAYREKFVNKQEGCCQWIVSKLNLLWLKTFARNGCWATKIEGADYVAEERAAIKQMNAKRDILVASLAHTDMIFTADKELCSSETQPDRLVTGTPGRMRQRYWTNTDTSNYYMALRNRVKVLAPSGLFSKELAAYLEADLQELRQQVVKHNQNDRTRSKANSQFIEPNWIAGVKKQMAATEYKIFINEFTLEDICVRGIGRLHDFANHYLLLFDSDHNTDNGREDFVKVLRQDIVKKHGSQFARLIATVDVNEFVKLNPVFSKSLDKVNTCQSNYDEFNEKRSMKLAEQSRISSSKPNIDHPYQNARLPYQNARLLNLHSEISSNARLPYQNARLPYQNARLLNLHSEISSLDRILDSAKRQLNQAKEQLEAHQNRLAERLPTLFGFFTQNEIDEEAFLTEIYPDRPGASYYESASPASTEQ